MPRKGTCEEEWRRAGYGEDTVRGRLSELINETIQSQTLPFSRSDVQIKVEIFHKRFYDDIVIWKEHAEKREAACVIELKIPCGWTPLDDELVDAAMNKAAKSNFPSDYFGTWNVNEFVLWKTFDPVPIIERRKSHYKVAQVRKPHDIDNPAFKEAVKGFAGQFLRDLMRLERKETTLQLLPLDTFFIILLRSIVDGFVEPVTDEIIFHSKHDKNFRRRLNEWYVSQGWIPPTNDEEYEKVGRQFLYLLLNKILFYNTLMKTNSNELKPISLSSKNSSNLRKELQKYFDKAQEVTKDYETIFGSNFLETIHIPDNIIPRFAKQLSSISKYDFSNLEYRDIGRIFDQLIPENERHKLGQYFTREDVVDLINAFCIRDRDATVADFGCGAGTFLVRSYARLKTMAPTKTHSELLRQIIGVDISKFAAHLSTINLANRYLENVKNYPRVLYRDFFKTFLAQPYEIAALGHRTSTTVVIDDLDAVVGNPPYTRREELEDFIPNYKATLESADKRDWNGDIAVKGKASIYAWFFLHGLRFVKQNGRLGYLTSDAWLDVDYGKHLQYAFLKKSKIVAILESRVERWFPDAAINTIITILQRTDNEKERDSNIVKFVQFKVPLSKIIPPTTDERERMQAVNQLVEQIDKTTTFFEDDQLIIFPKLQSELCHEGLKTKDVSETEEILESDEEENEEDKDE